MEKHSLQPNDYDAESDSDVLHRRTTKSYFVYNPVSVYLIIALIASLTACAYFLTQEVGPVPSTRSGPIVNIDLSERYFYDDLVHARARAELYSQGKEEVRQLPVTAAHALPISAPTPTVAPVVSCYYNTPTPQATGALLPANINPHLCTHLNVAFARLQNKTIQLTDCQLQTIIDLGKLRKINPNLKILLSIGGAGNNNGFSDMVVNHASRKTFIKSLKYILRNYTLDGVDLDWEFPAFHGEQRSAGKRERQHFSQLLREIRVEYEREKRNYLLTVAVAAPETIVDVSYDIDQLNLYVDYVNVMTYDFHSYTRFTPFTGLNSPLYARGNEQLYMATLNINYTVQMYLSKGLDRDKVVVGIPTYGHTFTLVNPNNFAIGSPASGYGSLGALGFVNYPDICLFWQNFKNEVSVVVDKDAKVPYLYRQYEWVSYDTPESVMDKAKFIRDQGLRGAMIYSLNADDYDGICGGDIGTNVKFPLSESIKNTLINKYGLLDVSST